MISGKEKFSVVFWKMAVSWLKWQRAISDKHHYKDHYSVKCTVRWQYQDMTAGRGRV